MAIEYMTRAQAIDRYLANEDRRFRQMISRDNPQSAYRAEGEPISALYANRLDCLPIGIRDATDPYKATAICEATNIDWTDIALEIFEKQKKYGIEFTDVFRGGTGLYHNLPNKRDFNWREFKKFLVDERYATALYQEGFLDNWWAEEGRPLLVDGIIRKSNDRTLENLDAMIADPERVIGDKPEETGTGLEAPLNTRRGLADHIQAYADRLRTGLEEYIPEIETAVEQWPNQGAYIYTPSIFEGMIGAHRSDAKATMFTVNKLILESMSREVGNDFTSPFHNRDVDPPAYQLEWWQQVTDSSVHWLPQQPEGYLAVFGTPSIAIPGSARDIVTWPVDFGYTINPARFSGTKFVVPSEVVKFGADQISLSGIMLQTSIGRQIAMTKSGVPWTMVHYVAMIGDALRHVIKKHHLHVRILQVGDDVHLVGPRDEMEWISAELGNWLRSKAIIVKEGQWAIRFFLGHYILDTWDGKRFSWMQPRPFKSVSSAIRMKKYEAGSPMVPPTPIMYGVPYPLATTPEAQEQVQVLVDKYHDFVCFDGTLAEHLQYMTRHYIPGKKEFADKTGISEDWVAEIFGFGGELPELKTPAPAITEVKADIPTAAIQNTMTTAEPAPAVTTGSEKPALDSTLPAGVAVVTDAPAPATTSDAKVVAEAVKETKEHAIEKKEVVLNPTATKGGIP